MGVKLTCVHLGDSDDTPVVLGLRRRRKEPVNVDGEGSGRYRNRIDEVEKLDDEARG